MVLRRLLSRLAASAPVPVLPVAGLGMRDAVTELRLRPEFRCVETPAAAGVLVVAGTLPDDFAEPLALLHDGMPHPRAIVSWHPQATTDAMPGRFAHPILVTGDADDLVAAVVTAQRELLTGLRPSSPAVAGEVGRVAWQGVGPYGQGGTGMTGGVPYGRPMAEVAPDRDGLRLDVLPLTVGPFFPRFPPGLRLDLAFAGDVVVECAVPVNPFIEVPRGAVAVRPSLDIFVRALFGPVSVAELELARARDHLAWVGDALTTHGLGALGQRALRLAGRLRPEDAPAVRRLARRIEWTQVLGWATRGVGRLSDEGQGILRGCGPVARAAGLLEDARSDEPAYQALGFAPIVHQGGDAAARWRQRLAEAEQSLDLALRAGERQTEATGRIESPRGLLTAGSGPATCLLPLIPALVTGLEWGDAVAALVSLDLDLEEAALAERMAATGMRRR